MLNPFTETPARYLTCSSRIAHNQLFLSNRYDGRAASRTFCGTLRVRLCIGARNLPAMILVALWQMLFPLDTSSKN